MTHKHALEAKPAPTGRAQIQTTLTDEQRGWTSEQLFDLFWAAYPNKTAKKAARERWKKLNPSADIVERMLSALAWQRLQPKWLKEGGEYVPHPATWLNQERWDDEPPAREATMLSSRAAKTLAASRTFLEMVNRNVPGGNHDGSKRRPPVRRTDEPPK